MRCREDPLPLMIGKMNGWMLALLYKGGDWVINFKLV